MAYVVMAYISVAYIVMAGQDVDTNHEYFAQPVPRVREPALDLLVDLLLRPVVCAVPPQVLLPVHAMEHSMKHSMDHSMEHSMDHSRFFLCMPWTIRWNVR